MDKKRRSVRISTALPVCWVRRSGRVNGFAGDVNEHGLFLRTEEPAAAGSLLQLELSLPDGGAPITAYMVARFVGRTLSGTGIGMEFYLLGPSERRRWVRYYRQLATQLQAVA